MLPPHPCFCVSFSIILTVQGQALIDASVPPTIRFGRDASLLRTPHVFPPGNKITDKVL